MNMDAEAKNPAAPQLVLVAVAEKDFHRVMETIRGNGQTFSILSGIAGSL